jgi:hypothetical protein
MGVDVLLLMINLFQKRVVVDGVFVHKLQQLVR